MFRNEEILGKQSQEKFREAWSDVIWKNTSEAQNKEQGHCFGKSDEWRCYLRVPHSVQYSMTSLERKHSPRSKMDQLFHLNNSCQVWWIDHLSSQFEPLWEWTMEMDVEHSEICKSENRPKNNKNIFLFSCIKCRFYSVKMGFVVDSFFIFFFKHNLGKFYTKVDGSNQ